MALEQADFVGILAIIAAVGAISYGAGQWRKGRSDSTSEALKTAQGEVEVYRDKVDRLEKDLADLQETMHELRQEMASLRAENETMRSLLSGGEHLREVLSEEIGRGTARVIEHLNTLASRGESGSSST